MDELLKSLLQIGGPTAVVAAAGLWLYLRTDSQRVAGEQFIRDFLVKAVEADARMAVTLEGIARILDRDRGKP